jgi:hypothetical protein
VLLVRAEQPGAEPASVRLTRDKGPTDPARRHPGQLRHLLGGSSYLLNHVHTADDPADTVRELGVLLDDAGLTEAYQAAQEGHDATADAVRIGRGLYRQTRHRDLMLQPALARLPGRVRALAVDPAASPLLRAALSEAVPPGGEQDPAPLLETLWRHRVVPDRWDVIVAGSHLLPMSRPVEVGSVR